MVPTELESRHGACAYMYKRLKDIGSIKLQKEIR